MIVGVAEIDLRIPEVHSLKEKRGVVRRVVERVRNRFPVSAAEVDNLDVHQTATIGMAIVTNDGRLADSIIDRALDYIDDLHLAEISRVDREILHL